MLGLRTGLRTTLYHANQSNPSCRYSLHPRRDDHIFEVTEQAINYPRIRILHGTIEDEFFGGKEASFET